MAEQTEIRRTRLRRQSLRLSPEKRKAIVKRVLDFADADRTARDVDLEQRMQRYAKYRMWTEGEGGPWPGSSDIPLSDMQEKSLRVQDTLHNAVMANRPAINAMAVHRVNAEKQKAVDHLLDYQFFEEARGEHIVGEMAEAFINEGVFTVFVPWITEIRRQPRVLQWDPLPPDAFPPDHFQALIQTLSPDAIITPLGDPEQPWDFRFMTPRMSRDGAHEFETVEVSFYTLPDGRIEGVFKGDVDIYDGPQPRVVDYDDVLHPPRAANLQPPGPSNPGGATHVILRDFPTKDEIARLKRRGFYDLMTREDEAALMGYKYDPADDEDAEELQRDDLAGTNADSAETSETDSHHTVTRFLCFDRFDIDGDGLDEDVMWWVLKEPEMLVRARVLQEVYPSLRPDHPRPLAEASLFPIRGRRIGISMLEQLEGLHDAIKTFIDQAADANTIGIVPFGFYRPTSSMQSERIRLEPGELYPLADPQRDVNFPQIGNPQAQGMALNLITLLQQWEERVTVVGDLQLGRVPAGKSSALRTTSNMQMLAGQGEARPERILRRFFGGLAQMFQIMHDLNQHFLPKGKQIRVSGPLPPSADPYVDFNDRSMIGGRFQFTFTANALNTSKAQMQQSLERMFTAFVNALFVQLGITRPENVFAMARDMGKAWGIDPAERGYISEPFPGVNQPRILAEEVLIGILTTGEIPPGIPGEPGGWIEHFGKFQALTAQFTDEKVDTGEITPEQAQMVQGYLATAAQRAGEQQQQMQMAANADAAGAGAGAGNPGGRPPEQAQGPGGNPVVSGGAELIDEALPGAGGGANP